jgi:hypothetical protein
VKLSYKVESESIDTDQSDAPIDVVITKQPVEVSVPMVEGQLEKLAGLIPSCKLITDTIDPTRKRLEISGESGGSLAAGAKMLVLTPVSGNANDIVTLYHAACLPEFDMSFEKGTNIHIYNLRFVALRGENGYVAFGDPLAMESEPVAEPEPSEPEPSEPEPTTPEFPTDIEPAPMPEVDVELPTNISPAPMPEIDPNLPEQVSPTPMPEVELAEVTTNAEVNLRSEASSAGGDATIIMNLPAGTVLTIAGVLIDDHWLPVIYEDADGNDITGYVSKAYVNIAESEPENPTEGESL